MGGVDKAALVVRGVTLLDRVLLVARPVGGRLVVAGPLRPTTVTGVDFRPDVSPGGGPVPPILAGAVAAEAEAGLGGVLLVIAVDMPFVTTPDLERLVAAVREGSCVAAAPVDDSGRTHPLLAAYRVSYLHTAAAALALGPGSAARELLRPPHGDGHVARVKLDRRATLNVNTPADLRHAESQAGGAG